MAFTPSIQALIGGHSPNYSGNIQCCPDWSNQKVYFNSLVSGTRYVSRVGLISGVQELYQSTSAYTHAPSSDAPVTIDLAGNLYIAWSGSPNGGGITKINSSTLAQISFSGTGASNLPTGYPGLSGGCFTNIPSNPAGVQFILSASIGGIFGILDYHAVFNEEVFAGRSVSWSGTSPGGISCSGPDRSGKGYVLVSENNSPGTQILRIYLIETNPVYSWTIGDWPTQNSQITSTEIFDLIPTDIDAGWTEIHRNGVCIDHSDGNLIICLTGQTGATTPGYYIKANASTGAVIWKVGVTDISALSGSQMQFSSVRYNQYSYFGNSGHTVTTINTVDGSSSTQTANLDGITAYSAQCYNDLLGGIVLMTTFNNTGGSPTRLNSTPTSYTGWSVLYVNAPPPHLATNTHATQLRIWGNWH